MRTFTTNEDLHGQFAEHAQEGGVIAVFTPPHCAISASAAWKMKAGAQQEGAKVNGGAALTLHLEPAAKVIRNFRAWFPSAMLVGWKYEMDGSREQALARAQAQIEKNRTTACVVNGRAYGPGFGYLSRAGELTHLDNKQALCDYLANLLTWEAAGISGTEE